jgi:hypothetical protein
VSELARAVEDRCISPVSTLLQAIDSVAPPHSHTLYQLRRGALGPEAAGLALALEAEELRNIEESMRQAANKAQRVIDDALRAVNDNADEVDHLQREVECTTQPIAT